MPRVLILGATEDLGKATIDRFLKENFSIVVLVKEEENNRQIFGKNVDYVTSLSPESFWQVSTVISCLPSSKLNFLGITFSQLVESIKNYLPAPGEKVIFDFTHPSNEIKELWGAVDDVVMGGISNSNIRLANNRGIFSGIVSTENNGGFASIRTRNFSPPLDLADYSGIELRVQGDGKRYKFITRCEGKWDGIGYCYSFDTIYNFSQTIRIAFQDLIPVFRAKTVSEAGNFDASKVYSLQLMLSKFEYDKELNPLFSPGLFGLEIEYIKAYGGQVKPQLILVGSGNEALLENSDCDLLSRTGVNFQETIFNNLSELMKNF